MEDHQIIELYWSRLEQAITETAKKYGRYCYSIAYGILHSNQDSEECVNDTYLRAWDSIPPTKPERFQVFLGKITRNLSLDKCRYNQAEKRGSGQLPLVLEELHDCIPAGNDVEQLVEIMALAELLNRFLESLSPDHRRIFMRRYWYFSEIKEIAGDLGMSESKVKMSLLRSRKRLKQLLEQEGVTL